MQHRANYDFLKLRKSQNNHLIHTHTHTHTHTYIHTANACYVHTCTCEVPPPIPAHLAGLFVAGQPAICKPQIIHRYVELQ